MRDDYSHWDRSWYTRVEARQRITVAIDPGRDGAVAVVDGLDRLLFVAGWRLLTHGYKRRLLFPDGVREFYRGNPTKSPFELGADMAWHISRRVPMGSWFRISVEDTYVGRNSRTAIRSAQWSGMFVGALAKCLTPRLAGYEYVQPSQWRRVAFGSITAKRRRALKEEIATMVFDRFSSVPFIQPERDPDQPLSSSLDDHMTDALGIAIYSMTKDQQEKDSAARGDYN